MKDNGEAVRENEVQIEVWITKYACIRGIFKLSMRRIKNTNILHSYVEAGDCWERYNLGVDAFENRDEAVEKAKKLIARQRKRLAQALDKLGIVELDL